MKAGRSPAVSPASALICGTRQKGSAIYEQQAARNQADLRFTFMSQSLSFVRSIPRTVLPSFF